MAVQRASSSYGYGQINPTGIYDPETRAAIEAGAHRLSPRFSAAAYSGFKVSASCATHLHTAR